MSLTADEVEIARPCPIDLPDTFRSGAKSQHCDHCDKTVYLLSSLTETQARAFVRDRANDSICVTYLVGANGQIQFRSEPDIVPPSRLRRRATAATVGLGAALASACAPHENPRVRTTEVEVRSEPPVMAPSVVKPVEPRRADPPPGKEPDRALVAGGLAPLPDATPLRGRMAPPRTKSRGDR